MPQRYVLPPAFERLLLVQDDVFRRAQAVDAGLTPSMIRNAVRGKRWQRLPEGVYLATTGRPSRHQLLVAGLLAGGDDSALGLWTAATLLGLRIAQDTSVHVISTARSTSSRGVLRMHRTDRLTGDTMYVGRYRITNVERTILDLAPRLTDMELRTLVAHAVQKRLTTVSKLRARVGACRQPATARLRACILAIGRGAESGDEVLLVDLAAERGLQFRANGIVVTPRGSRKGDLVLDEVMTVVQLESAEHHTLPEDVEADLERDKDMAAAGYDTYRIAVKKLRRDPDGEIDALVRLVQRRKGDRNISGGNRAT